MSEKLTKESVARNYAFLAVMLGSMILGSIVGWIFPQVKEGDEVIKAGATVLKPLGTLFLNMMFCIVVPMVFSSIAGSVATMKSRKRAGKIMGTTILTFIITGAIAAVIMIVIMKIFPPVLEPWSNLTEGVVDDPISIPDLIVNFFTVGDFSGLLSRSAMLPLIVGISYEFNRWAGRHDGPITRILVAPGLWLQNFTTFEPDDSMMEVGIKALELVLPEKQGEDAW